MTAAKTKTRLTDEQAYKNVLAKLGSKSAVARVCGLPRQSITRWTSVPSKYVPQVAEAAGMHKRDVLPSLFSD